MSEEEKNQQETIEELIKKIKNRQLPPDTSHNSSPDDNQKTHVHDERIAIYETYKPYQHESLEDQNKRLREEVKNRAFKILWAELFFLVGLILLAGFGHKTNWFYLNDFVITAFSTGCLVQTFFIIRYITVNLFPNNNFHKSNPKGDTHIHHHHHK